MTNRDFSEKNELFKSACELADVKPTQRQASKFRMGRGLSFTKRIEAKSFIKKDSKNE